MHSVLRELRAAGAATVTLALLCCGAYPLAVFAFGQILFPKQANGSLLIDPDGTIRGSELLGQNFAGPEYFHPRPSAAGPQGYDATSSGGSNLGPTSRALFHAIQDRIERYRAENSLPSTTPIPADAVTTSASGLDPHISLRNADIQSDRVARARGRPRHEVQKLIQAHLESSSDPLRLAPPRINVLLLNRTLDAATKPAKPSLARDL
ncbi:MAG: potassium-transporting ATPase subunit KdpC [Verrucomicrobiales bacterium]|nr:potassium-transporting ATPase subunit KdpC [Verrucomicrobiales bacterium]